MYKNKILILGDIITFAIVTLLGFVSHSQADVSFLLRFFAALIPVIIAWLILSPWVGLLYDEVILEPKNLLCIPLAMLFVIPLAASLRGFILNAPIQPMFVLAFFTTNTIGLVLWRVLYIFINNKIK